MSEKKVINVLFVEDNEIDLEIAISSLKEEADPYEIFICHNGEEAMDFLIHKGKYTDDQKYPKPDIIVVDVKMPQMDGYEFLKFTRMLERYKRTPIIVYTGYTGMRDLFKMEGVDAFIAKSSNPRELINTIKRFASHMFSS